MASTEERIRQLIRDNLDIGHEVDFDATLADADVSSIDAIAFAKLVGEEFGIEISREKFSSCPTIQSLVDYLDSKAG